MVVGDYMWVACEQCDLGVVLVLTILKLLSHCLEFYSGVSDLHHQVHHSRLSSADSYGQ